MDILKKIKRKIYNGLYILFVGFILIKVANYLLPNKSICDGSLEVSSSVCAIPTYIMILFIVGVLLALSGSIISVMYLIKYKKQKKLQKIN